MDTSLLYAGAGAAVGGFLLSKWEYVAIFLKRKLTFSCTVGGAVSAAIVCDLNTRLLNSKQYRDIRLDDEAKTLGLGTHILKIDGVRCVVNHSRDKLDHGYTYECTLTVPKSKRTWLEDHIDIVWKVHKSNLNQGLPIYTIGFLSWELATIRKFRSIDTIKHPLPGLPRQILSSIIEWEAAQQPIIDRGENSHLGIMLAGVPGSGKTSLAIALASELRRPIYLVKDTQNLASHISKVPEEAIILFEECDVYLRTRYTSSECISSESSKENLVAELLSALDGPLSRPGRVYIFTTNHLDRLDPALLRKGRCDFVFQLNHSYCDAVVTEEDFYVDEAA